MIVPKIVDRAGWKAKPWEAYSPLAHSIGIVAHHSVTDPGADEAAMCRRIQQEHFDSPEGYVDIAYNFLVGASGNLYEGRGWTHMNGANGKATNRAQLPPADLYVGPDIGNSNTISACYLGNPPDDPDGMPTDAALETYAWLKTEHIRRFGEIRVLGHRQIRSTDCPGNALFDWWVVGPAIPPSELQPAPPPPPPAPTEIDTEDLMAVLHDLYVGDSGLQVRNAQSLLNVRGAGLDVDGNFGPATAAAVEKYLRDRDLHNLDGTYLDHIEGWVWESLLTREDG